MPDDAWSRRRFLATFLKAAGCYAVAAGTPLALSRAATGPAGRFRFPQGLASGDPTPDSVILWTRVEAVNGRTGPVPLTCEVAADPDFASIVAEKVLTADASSDHTVRVLVHDLEPDTRYYYRFRADGDVTPLLGRTRTAPERDADRPLRLAWASCQGYEAGYFGAYRMLVNRDAAAPEAEQLDLVLHMGDFVYEALGYGSVRQVPPFPSGGGQQENGATYAVTVDDYRHLYKTYLSDPDLMAARARWPFVVTWDDHEFTNDCWQGVATYTPENKPSQTRKYAANQAWFEFIPAYLSGVPGVPGVDSAAHDFRPVEGGVSDAPLDSFDAHGFSREPNNVQAIDSLCIYRSLRWGKHAEIIVTDTRSYRTDHAVPDSLNLQISETQNYLSPLPLVQLCDAGRQANGGNPPETIQLGDQTIPNPRRNSPPGTMLGPDQKAWFKDTLRRSDATWAVWANSLPTMPMRLDLDQVDPEAFPTVFTTDTWDGFQVERAELFAFIRDAGVGNLLSLVGDHHNNFAGQLFLDFDAEVPEPLGAEFAVAGISSPSVWHALVQYVPEDSPLRPLVLFDNRPHGGDDPAVPNLNLTFLHGSKSAVTATKTGSRDQALAAANPRQNPHLAYVDSAANGIAVAEIGPNETRIDLITIVPPWKPTGSEGSAVLRTARFRVPARSSSEPARLEGPYIDGAPLWPFA